MSNSVVPFIEDQFPDNIKTQSSSVGSKAMVVYFMEAFYEWLEKSGNAKARIDELSKMFDTDYAVGEFFERLRTTYLQPLPASIVVDKALLIKHIREVYLSKGTEACVEFLFRVLFDEAVDVRTHPAKDINNPGEFLFLDYSSIHRSIAFDRLDEDFFLGQSITVTQEYIDAATAQGYDVNTFRGTVVLHAPDNFSYRLYANVSPSLVEPTLLSLTHPAGTGFEIVDYTADCITVDTTDVNVSTVDISVDNQCAELPPEFTSVTFDNSVILMSSTFYTMDSVDTP